MLGNFNMSRFEYPLGPTTFFKTNIWYCYEASVTKGNPWSKSQLLHLSPSGIEVPFFWWVVPAVFLDYIMWMEGCRSTTSILIGSFFPLWDSNRNSKMEDKQTSLDCSKLQLHFQYSYSHISAPNTRTTCHGHSQQVKSTPFNQLHPHLLAAFHQLLLLFLGCSEIHSLLAKTVPCHRFTQPNRHRHKDGRRQLHVEPRLAVKGRCYTAATPPWETKILKFRCFVKMPLFFFEILLETNIAPFRGNFEYGFSFSKGGICDRSLEGIISLKCYLFFCCVKIHGSGLQGMDVWMCGCVGSGVKNHMLPQNLQYAQHTWKHITSHVSMLFP